MDADDPTHEAYGDAAECAHPTGSHAECSDHPTPDARRRTELNERLRHGVEGQLQETGSKQQRQRNPVDGYQRKRR